MNESDKAVMQQALDALIDSRPFSDYPPEAYKRHGQVIGLLVAAIAQPVEPHDLQKRLEALDFYEDIAEYYAKCAISPEALRDWVSERMDMPAIAQPAHKSIASDAIECVAQSVQPADKNRVLNGLMDAFMQTAPGAVLMAIGNAFQYIDSLDITIAQPVEPATCEDCGGDGIVLASQNQWACQTCSESPIAQPVEPTLTVTDAEIKISFPFNEGWNHSDEDLHRYRRALKTFLTVAQPESKT